MPSKGADASRTLFYEIYRIVLQGKYYYSKFSEIS